MQTAAARSLLVTEFSSLSRFGFTQAEIGQEGFYQQLASELTRRVHSRQIFENLAQRLIATADRAYSMRRMEIVDQVCQILMNLPLPGQYESIRLYYQALCFWRSGKPDKSRVLLEHLTEEAPLHYRTKALLSMGTTFYLDCNFQSALPLYIEAGKASLDGNRRDTFSAIHSQKMIAVIKGIDGNHQGALDDLEKLFPLAHSVCRSNGPLFCDFLNSYAVELTEVGRIEEARNVMRLVLASPFASAYSEWRETGDEIKRRGRRPFRSTVAFTQRTPKENNLAFLPQHEEERKWSPNPFQQSAPVADFQKWKKKMGKKSNGEKIDGKSIEEMSEKELFVKIMHLCSEDDITEAELREILKSVEEVRAKRGKK